MTWKQFTDIDPSYSGYAWVKRIDKYDKHFYVFLARIWTHEGKPTEFWVGWNVDSDEALWLNRMCSDYEVILLEKPA